MIQNKKTFQIEHTLDEATGRPFGSTYSGEFVVRRPTMADRHKIALVEAAGYAGVDPLQLAPQTLNTNYIFAHVTVLAEKKPDWFDQSKLWAGDSEAPSDDDRAILAVWKEVRAFLDSFRPAPAA